MKFIKASVAALLACFGACTLAQAQVFNQINNTQTVVGISAAQTANGTGLSSAIAPATPAVTTVKSSAGTINHIDCFNILATPVYVKVYDATSVTLGTTSASYEFMCPGNTAGAGFIIQFARPIGFTNAIKYAVTGAISLTDNTAITASSVIVNVGFD